MKEINWHEYNQNISASYTIDFQYQNVDYLSNCSYESQTPANRFNSVAIKPLKNFDKHELLKKVTNYELSGDVKKFVAEYDHAFGHRDNYLWKWLGIIYRETGVTLSSIEDTYFDSITDAKIILTMAFSLLDDISEFYKDEELLNKIINVINNPEGDIDNKDDKLVFFKNIWNHFKNIISKYPRYEEFKDIFWYDFSQVLNSVRYNVLVDKNPEMLNLNEMHNYDCHNMIVFLLNGIDLMVSPKFDKKDLPHLRTAFWHAQQMARIGNWLSTWKREIKEEDFNSGVVGYAISTGILNAEELKTLNHEEIIEKIENSNIKEHFQKTWETNLNEIKKLKHKIKSVDLDAYSNGLDNLIKLHMASEGYK